MNLTAAYVVSWGKRPSLVCKKVHMDDRMLFYFYQYLLHKLYLIASNF